MRKDTMIAHATKMVGKHAKRYAIHRIPGTMNVYSIGTPNEAAKDALITLLSSEFESRGISHKIQLHGSTFFNFDTMVDTYVGENEIDVRTYSYPPYSGLEDVIENCIERAANELKSKKNTKGHC